ncbi:unnamed protein product, partial [Polarella glacialis]
MMAALGQVAEGIRRVHSQDTPRSEGSDQGTDVSSLGYIGGSAMSELGQSEARRGVSAASASSSLAALKDRQAKCMQAMRSSAVPRPPTPGRQMSEPSRQFSEAASQPGGMMMRQFTGESLYAGESIAGGADTYRGGAATASIAAHSPGSETFK